MSLKLAWIGVDWGTSNLRVYGVDFSGRVSLESSSARGMNTLQSSEFEGALLDLIDPWLVENETIPVFVCGMAGSRQGWHEVSYRQIPCQPISSEDLTIIPTIDRRIKVSILPGLSQLRPPDVMRGEETQIAGLLVQEPKFDGVVCLPGSHSKWVNIRNGLINGFQTFLTGELFDLISSHSVIRHSVSTDDYDQAAFLKAASEAVVDPRNSFKNLFSLRASTLLADEKLETGKSRLSGMIIGQEIGMALEFWKGRNVVLIGAEHLMESYSIVLGEFNVETRCVNSKEATVLGFSVVAQKLIHAS